jgi:hypothetical protein
MKQAIKNLVRKAPIVGKYWGKQGAYPAGHYYSPIPAKQDVLSYINSRPSPGDELPGLNLNKEGQHELLVEFTKFYHELPFQETPANSLSLSLSLSLRYYYDNEWFSYSDAIFLYSFLRQHKPKRIIEVGSGFSSAVILDTIDGFFPDRPEVTFIEPYPERLLGLLRNNDKEQVRLIDKKIQDVATETFLALESGDLLFIDSSHVVKCGSDLQLIMFEILPHLKPGVFVHFHDVFYPFDYPSDWLTEGRYWNENYFLRAFLSYNSEWSIRFFNDYAHLVFGDFIKNNMPLCARNKGGSLYIQREE